MRRFSYRTQVVVILSICISSTVIGCGGSSVLPPSLPPGQSVPADVIAPPSGATVTNTISPSGGSQAIPNIVTLTWPQNAFSSATQVTVSATASKDTDSDFNSSAVLFQPAGKRLYEIRVNTGRNAPTGAVQATITMPQELLNSLPAGMGVQAFIQFLEEGGDDSIDAFEIVDATIDLNAKLVQLSVPPEAFTNSRTADGTFEAIFTLAATPGTNLTHSSIAGHTLFGPAGLATNQCQAKSIGSPLAGVDPSQLRQTDPFDPPKHFGVDLAAKDGDGIVAVADGTITNKGNQLSKTTKNRFGQPSGWGNYIVLTTSDGSAVLYAHLLSGSTDNIAIGTKVNQGANIGKADSSGGVTGPHLHLEYAPNGKIFDKSSKIDPLPCIGSTVSGSIMVGDDGPAADDAFAVSVDGIDFGTTTIGGTNNIAVNNLRQGTHSLTITCVVAPDNDGTLGVALSNGWTFADGTTSISADLALNQTVNFTFIVPTPSPNLKFFFTPFPHNYSGDRAQ